MRALAQLFCPSRDLITVAIVLALAIDHRANAHELLEWPHNLPRTEKYYPEHEAHVKRELVAQQRLEWQTPVGIRKMSDDPGEKFFLDYWDFGEMSIREGDLKARSGVDMAMQVEGRSSTLQSAVGLHASDDRSAFGLFGRDVFSRDFQCPGGTNACTNIGQPDLCCNTGETCVSTSGGVGCCPNGQSCGNTVASCDTAAGYTSCPNSNNGGCCVPGAQCLDTGCVFYGTQVVTTTLPTATVTARTSSTHTTTSAPITSFTVVSPSGSVTTVIIPGIGTTVTTTVVSPTTIIIVQPSSTTTNTSCSSGFFSCPVSLGGGCCATGQACATGNQCPDISSSSIGTASAPVRPTTVASSSSTTASSTLSTTAPSTLTTYASVCPGGYYMCSAVYLGGCCQVDRDCHTTFCPPTASTSILTSGVTAVIPATGTAATTTTTTTGSTNSNPTTTSAPSTTVVGGTCAVGWYLCAASDGGGCCPVGYSCGTSCTASVSGVAPQPKQNPSSAAVNTATVAFLVLSLGTAIGMVLL